MNKLHEYMKANHDMKTFTHVPQEKKIINLKTETIKGKRFYVLLAVISILQSQPCYLIGTTLVYLNGVSQ